MNSEFAFCTGNAIYVSVCCLLITKLSSCDWDSGGNNLKNVVDYSSVLNVATDEEIAKNIAYFLSGGNAKIVST